MNHTSRVIKFPNQVDPVRFFARAGWVYVLANESMPGAYKIGRTTGAVQARMNQLYTSGVAAPFECLFAEWFADCHAAETFIHQELSGHRIEARREFFAASPKEIERAFMTYSAIGEDVPDSLVALYSDRRRRVEGQEQVNGALVARGVRARAKAQGEEVPF